MSWTTTLDASHKVKASGGHAVQFGRHIGRDVDAFAGFSFGHSNGGIDPTRAHLNRTMVNDGAGGYRTPVATVDADGHERAPSAELSDYVESRVAGKVTRKDAVIMRPFVFKADPEWYDAHCPDWRVSGLNDAALRLHEEATRFIEGFGGQQNVAFYSDHLDEDGYPERQIGFVPIDAAGKLAQKSFFTGPAQLREMHQDLRRHLRDTCGYDADLGVSPRSREHLSSVAFSRKADQTKALNKKASTAWQNVLEGSKANSQRGADLAARAAELARREKQVEADQEQVEADRKAFAAARSEAASLLDDLRAARTYDVEKAPQMMHGALLAAMTNARAPIPGPDGRPQTVFAWMSAQAGRIYNSVDRPASTAALADRLVKVVDPAPTPGAGLPKKGGGPDF